MLCLSLNQGEYITIGESVVVQMYGIVGDRCSTRPERSQSCEGRFWNAAVGSGPVACSAVPVTTGGRFRGTGARSRRFPPCGSCWIRWTEQTAMFGPCAGSSTTCSPSDRQTRFHPADGPAGILSRAQPVDSPKATASEPGGASPYMPVKGCSGMTDRISTH